MSKELISIIANAPEFMSPVTEVVKKKYKPKKLGTIRHRIDGGIIWEMSVVDGQITATEAKYEELELKSGGSTKKLILKDDCLYIEAINKKNAIRKTMRGKAFRK